MITRSVVSDDFGRFVIVGLQAGSYEITVKKPGFVDSSYGAAGAGRKGTLIDLAVGQHRSSLIVRAFRGAVLTGTVFDVTGEPAPHQYVKVLRQKPTASGRRLVEVKADSAASGGYGSWTDDRGVFRLYGLLPGTYLICATRGNIAGMPVRETTPAAVARARSLLAGGSAGSPASSPSSASPLGPTTHLAPVCHPSALIPAHAVPVTIDTGEERDGLDIRLVYGRATDVDGMITDNRGRPAPDAAVQIISDDATGSQTVTSGVVLRDGKFRLGSVTPGRYVIEVRSGPNAGPARWGSVELDISGEDRREARVTLDESGGLSGRVVAHSEERDPVPSSIKISVVPSSPLPGSWLRRPATGTSRDGAFSFPALPPGSYRVAVELAKARGRSWTLHSVVVNGQDISDTPLVIGAGDRIHAVVTMTSAVARVHGLVQNVAEPRSGYNIVVFSTDRSFWYWDSRRIARAMLDERSEYSVEALPPGDYFLALVRGLEPGEEFDSAGLADLARFAVVVRLRPGESTRQDVRAGAVPQDSGHVWSHDRHAQPAMPAVDAEIRVGREY
jgi:hypothetical protein